jgi:shikimate dehydrogenase
VLTPLPEGGLAAHNTDGIGMLRDMSVRQGIDLRGRHVLLLGAGGAARGVAWNLLDAGIATLVIANRSADAANALATSIDDLARVHACRWEALVDSGPHDLIVNATSAGVLGGSLQLPTLRLRDGASCYDLSYGAAADRFLAWARDAGARRTADGLGMLLETAADAFELWHGQLPETEPVYRMLRPS